MLKVAGNPTEIHDRPYSFNVTVMCICIIYYVYINTSLNTVVLNSRDQHEINFIHLQNIPYNTLYPTGLHLLPTVPLQ